MAGFTVGCSLQFTGFVDYAIQSIHSTRHSKHYAQDTQWSEGSSSPRRSFTAYANSYERINTSGAPKARRVTPTSLKWSSERVISSMSCLFVPWQTLLLENKKIYCPPPPGACLPRPSLQDSRFGPVWKRSTVRWTISFYILLWKQATGGCRVAVVANFELLNSLSSLFRGPEFTLQVPPYQNVSRDTQRILEIKSQ